MEIEPESSSNPKIDVSFLPQLEDHPYYSFPPPPDKSMIGATNRKSNCTLQHTTGMHGLDVFHCVQRLFSRQANTCSLLPKSDAFTNV
jgi:hypothetical protein